MRNAAPKPLGSAYRTCSPAQAGWSRKTGSLSDSWPSSANRRKEPMACHRALLHDHDERATANRVSPEPDKEQDGLARYARRNKTKNKTVMCAASRRNKTENNKDLDRHWGRRRPYCRVTLKLMDREPPKGGSLKTLASGSENLLGANRTDHTHAVVGHSLMKIASIPRVTRNIVERIPI